jgi:hypothetical protein
MPSHYGFTAVIEINVEASGAGIVAMQKEAAPT